MNLVDLLLIIVLAATAFEGFKRGFLRQALEVGGVFLAIFLAARYGAAVGDGLAGVVNIGQYLQSIEVPYVDVSGTIESAVVVLNRALGYIVVFLGVVGITRLVAALLGPVVKLPVIGPVNRIAGVGLGLLKGLLYCVVLIWVANLVPIEAVENTMAGSGLSKLILSATSGLFEQLKELLGMGAA